jgi:hypothetical protein
MFAQKTGDIVPLRKALSTIGQTPVRDSDGCRYSTPSGTRSMMLGAMKESRRRELSMVDMKTMRDDHTWR